MIRRLTIVLAISAFALSAQTKKILVMGAGPDVKEYQSASPKANVIPVTKETVMKEIGDADAFIGTITPEMVRAGKKLKWTQIMSAGAEGVLFKAGGNDLRDSNIVLTNNQIVQGPEIADHALAMLLMLSRGLNKFYKNQQQELWQPRPYGGIELRGRTAVIIGAQIAYRAWAFGMNVIGVDPEDIPLMPIIQKVVKPDQLNEVLPEADVVFVSAPHTPMSNKLLGPKQS